MGFASTVALSAAACGAFAQSLTVGNPAPALRVDQWLKSTPITHFQKGRLYVVEFWATWCPSCRVAIPHLTQLAKQYAGHVVFAGVSIGEDQKSATDRSYIPKVRDFVQKEGAKMDYHVAVDRPDGDVATHWMLAAGEHGIPTAFVVDRQGRIAWIGQPEGLDQVLAQEVRGAFDIKAQEAARSKIAGSSMSNDPGANGTAEAVAMAVGEKDWKKVENVTNMIIAGDPSQEEQYSMFKMLALLHLDRPRAHAYAKHLMTGLYRKSTERLAALAEMMLDQDSGPAKPDIDFSYAIAQQAMAVSPNPDAWALDAMAYAQLHQNRLKLAMASENRALRSLGAQGRYSDEQSSALKSMVSLHMKLIQAKLAQPVK